MAKQSERWSFLVRDPRMKDHEDVITLIAGATAHEFPWRYLICQLEDDDGVPILHGYLETDHRIRVSTMLREFPLKDVVLAPVSASMTVEQSVALATCKDDCVEGPWSWGEPKRKKKRKRMTMTEWNNA